LVRYPVARVGDVPNGKMIGAEIGGRQILVANVDGEFFGMASVCTHMAGRLDKGSLEGNVVTCPRHGSRWDVKTGKLVQFSRPLPDEPIFKAMKIGDEICVEIEESPE
jgi:3-phenylpropionate/trans-cinnamate dioxygenase ferredoxin subunit